MKNIFKDISGLCDRDTISGTTPDIWEVITWTVNIWNPKGWILFKTKWTCIAIFYKTLEISNNNFV